MSLKKLPIFILILTLTSFTFAQEAECPVSQRFDTALNRCVSTTATLHNQTEYKECEGKEESERSACLSEAANRRESDTRKDYGDDVKSGDVTKGKTKQLVMNGLFASLSTVQLLVSEKSFSESCMSSKIFTGTSLAGFVKNIAFEKDVKKAVNKMKDEFKTEATSKSTMKDAQLTAFDFLEKEQSYLKKYAKDQEKFYKMLAMGYTASVVMGVYEMTPMGGAGACAKSSEESTKNETTNDKKPSLLEKGVEKLKPLEKFTSWIGTPIGVIVAGGIASLQSFQLSGHMGDMADEAGENVTKIQELKEKYMLSISNYCPDGRNDLAKPQCYCYTDKGAKNPNREKSGTCQNLWKAPDNLWAASSDALRGAGLRDSKGCVYIDGKFDPSCDCKRMRNPSGKNACMQVNLPPSAFAAIPNFSADTISTAINDTLSGNESSSKISDDINSQAALGQKLRDALIKKIDPKIKAETGKGADDAGKAFLSEAQRALTGSGRKIAIYNSPFEGLADARPTSGNISQAVAEISKSIPKISTASQKSSKKSKNDWSFDSSSDTSVMSFSDLESDQDATKKYKYNNNDINTDKGASIWNVISKRYTQSGLRRLFEDKKGLVE